MHYTPREMIEAIEKVNPMQLFFMKFFPDQNTHLHELVEFDYKKGRRRMAPFVAQRKGGKIVTRDGFETKTIRTPKIAPERIMTVDDISNRSFGEHIYTRRTPAERADELLAQDLNELEEYITNRKEWMARNIILDGKLNVVIPDEGVDVQVDYRFTNKTSLLGDAKWTQDKADPIKNLTEWRRAIIKNTGQTPSAVIMGTEAYELFIRHPKVKEIFDIRRMNFGIIEPRIKDKATTFCGRLQSLDLDIYTYDEWFINDEGIEQAMLPENTIIIISEKIGAFEYGSVTLLDQENSKFATYEGILVPQIITDSINNIKIVRMTSRPIPRPYDVDSWYVAEVV